MIIGAVAALSREARLVRRSASRAGCARDVLSRAGGIGPTQARSGARALVEQGATLLLSTGYAGGLDAAVGAGDLLLPEVIVDESGARHAAWAPAREQVLAVLPAGTRVHTGTMLSCETVIASVPDKRAAARDTGAMGVDLESAAVAAVGRESGVPVLVVRGVSDGVGRELPRAALVSTCDDGRVSLPRVLAALARRPWEIPTLVRLARDVGAAERTLEGVLVNALPRLVALGGTGSGLQ